MLFTWNDLGRDLADWREPLDRGLVAPVNSVRLAEQFRLLSLAFGQSGASPTHVPVAPENSVPIAGLTVPPHLRIP
jgi:hypothetical protein